MKLFGENGMDGALPIVEHKILSTCQGLLSQVNAAATYEGATQQASRITSRPTSYSRYRSLLHARLVSVD